MLPMQRTVSLHLLSIYSYRHGQIRARTQRHRAKISYSACAAMRRKLTDSKLRKTVAFRCAGWHLGRAIAPAALERCDRFGKRGIYTATPPLTAIITDESPVTDSHCIVMLSDTLDNVFECEEHRFWEGFLIAGKWRDSTRSNKQNKTYWRGMEGIQMHMHST